MKKLLRLAVVLGLAIAITGCAGTTPRLASTEKPGGQTLQQEGKALENQGDYTAAAEKYTKAIKLGNAEASYDLALLYYAENIPSKDQQEAYSRCFKLLKQAADQGYGPAQYELGYMYLAGDGTEKDPTPVLPWSNKRLTAAMWKPRSASAIPTGACLPPITNTSGRTWP